MSPLAIPSIFEQIRQTNLTAASRAGTTITAGGTAHTMGSWASLIDPTDNPSYGLTISVKDVGASATRTSFLLDIGFGATGGGGTIQILVPFLDCWGAYDGAFTTGKMYFFPVYIPSGVMVQARAQASTVSDTATVAVWLSQKPTYPFVIHRWQSYGDVAAASNGTPVTPGSGAFGSWTQIPASTTTSRAHAYWHVGYGADVDASIVDAQVLVEIGHGPDSGSVRSIGLWRFSQAASERMEGPIPSLPIYHPVPSGQQLWARMASAETEVRSVIIYAGG